MQTKKFIQDVINRRLNNLSYIPPYQEDLEFDEQNTYMVDRMPFVAKRVHQVDAGGHEWKQELQENAKMHIDLDPENRMFPVPDWGFQDELNSIYQTDANNIWNLIFSHV